MLVELLNTDPLNYEDENLEKEVIHSKELLKKIANFYNGKVVKLTDEHTNKPLGFTNKFVMNQDTLYVDVPNDINMKNKGVSTRADVLLHEDDDFFYANGFDLVDIAVTTAPRTMRLCNSVKTDPLADPQKQNQKDGMGTLLAELNEKNKKLDEQEKIIKQLQKDNKEVVGYKNLLEENKDLLDKKDEILARLAKYDTEEKNREIKNIAKKYQFDPKKEEELAIIEKIMKKDIDLKLMEELAERRAIIKQEEEYIEEKKPKGSKGEIEIDITDIKKQKKNKPQFSTREEYNKVLKDLGLTSEIQI